MIPLRDVNPSRTLPIVTGLLIAANVGAFVYELGLGRELREFMFAWGLVPIRLTLALRYHEESVRGALVTVFSSMFLHGGWMHLIGNMWYLWIFGDNIEDRLGHVAFLFFYLLAGVVAAFLHTAINATSQIPTVGASGAIAGVLGAYAAAFPRARVVTLVPLFPFMSVVSLPALIVLGLWFVLQFFQGTLSLGAANAGGVAVWAHVGGFVFGWIVMKALMLARPPRPDSGAWVEG